MTGVLPTASMQAGAFRYERGFCTHALALRGRSLDELEARIGFRRGRLASGATILFLEQSPTPADFHLGGYTYFSDGAVRGHKLEPENRGPYRMESLLKSEHGWSEEQIRKYKEKMIGTKIVVRGPERLAKLVPFTPHSAGEEYPPGSGIFQIRLVNPLRFRVKANILPGEKWMGDYF